MIVIVTDWMEPTHEFQQSAEYNWSQLSKLENTTHGAGVSKLVWLPSDPSGSKYKLFLHQW